MRERFFLAILLLLFTCFVQQRQVSAQANSLYIVNGLPENSAPFRVHVFSGDDDLGYHNLKVGEDFSWSFGFKVNTKFYGHFWWGNSKERGFAVFDSKIGEKCEWHRPRYNVCLWLVKEDGFYLAKKKNPTPQELVYMNWWMNKTTTTGDVV